MFSAAIVWNLVTGQRGAVIYFAVFDVLSAMLLYQAIGRWRHPERRTQREENE